MLKNRKQRGETKRAETIRTKQENSYAKLVKILDKNPNCDLNEACKKANISVRTYYRYVKKFENNSEEDFKPNKKQIKSKYYDNPIELIGIKKTPLKSIKYNDTPVELIGIKKTSTKKSKYPPELKKEMESLLKNAENYVEVGESSSISF